MEKIVVLTLGLCLGVAAALAFDEHDTKSIVALEMMGQEGLAGEAVRACQGMIATKSESQPSQTDSYRSATQYLQTIGLVLEARNNGHVPQWYTEIVQASGGTDPKACASARPGGNGGHETAPEDGKR